jgi:vacuolar-type H+-ATPase subunit D/Vma8
LAVNKTVEVQLEFRGVMGGSIPIVETRGEPPELPFSLGDTTALLYEETIAYIETTLEERERGETFRLKRLKTKTARSRV